MKKYFVMCEGSYDFFDTEEEAVKYAESLIEDFLDGNEWECENDDIFWGEVKQSGKFEKVECNPDAYVYALEDVS
ncbi:MAG: hypothetical protein WC877_00370 [Dehalococcoidales bacterium]|jgi:hypothetical protein